MGESVKLVVGVRCGVAVMPGYSLQKQEVGCWRGPHLLLNVYLRDK